MALNFQPDFTTSTAKKLPSNLNNPIDLSLFKEFENKLKIYTRISVMVDDAGQCQHFAKFQTLFDIIAVIPMNEKSLQSAIANLDIDIISFDLESRLSFYMKHKTLGSAIDKGIFFELNYTNFLNNSSRSQALSTSKQIIRASRCRGMIVSSGVTNQTPFQCRNFQNLKPILNLLGIDSNRSEKMVQDWPIKVVLNSRLRNKSYKQTVAIAGDQSLIDNSLENPSQKSDLSNYIKRKQDADENALDRIISKKQKI